MACGSNLFCVQIQTQKSAIKSDILFGVFTKDLQKMIISFIMSVCPFIGTYQSESSSGKFRENSYLENLPKFVDTF
jgi:hypothetical protein